MYHKGFTGIAHTGSLGLGVEHDGDRHVQIRGFVHKYMTVSRPRLNHRNRAVFHHSPDQSGASPWNQHIDISVQPHHLSGCLPVGICHQLNAVLFGSHKTKSFLDHRHNGRVGMDGIASSSQNHRVSRLKAEGEGIGGYIGPCLINHADDTHGHPFLTDQQAVGTALHGQHFTDGVLQTGHLANPLYDIVDPLIGQLEPVHQGRGHPLFFCQNHIRFIGF